MIDWNKVKEEAIAQLTQLAGVVSVDLIDTIVRVVVDSEEAKAGIPDTFTDSDGVEHEIGRAHV